MKSSSVHARAFSRIDTKKGKYVSLGKLAESFGVRYDRDKAQSMAYKYAEKCARMQGDWVEYDAMTEYMLYLLLERQYKQKMA